MFPNGKTDFNNANGNGQSGPNAAAGWSGEATLDIEWAYAIAPLAHIVLIAVPPAETEGVQGLPNLFKAISDQIDANPGGTVFSMSFGITEQTFGGAAAAADRQVRRRLPEGDREGRHVLRLVGRRRDARNARSSTRTRRPRPHRTAGWPASSPYVTAVGGTQLQYGWTWNPTSDIPFNADGSFNPAYFDYHPRRRSERRVERVMASRCDRRRPERDLSAPVVADGVLADLGDHRLVPDVAWNAAVNGGVLVYITAYPDYNGPASTSTAARAQPRRRWRR